MNQTDDRILLLLEESGLMLSPAVIAANLDYTRGWVSKRLRKLLEAGLVEKSQSSYYEITERGEQYLAGEINANILEDAIED
ncbi:winged helix-turn-helix domain-containing protein (plasmid) [Haloarcula marismortui]|uniref:winged helix-turn-helix domain-containing protein n=1 Tax=Haloarcula marismortui TaxID=2238 RepID=UPI003C71DA5D